ncbi:hypothetical protein C8J98_101523 [Luteibacter sp. OK325]|uniref:DUF6543 domain-containing protein n=1 Tax=Luteibacter sp. OK325 TaxID=2135670 RepID=UPI000D37ECD8|nr:DUF6543 domain-containing protein [Luteibacter sp. OK325]PTR35260.1 hypothetical protein C8J98_101523 [Luteibacter sp. OK325]
MDMAPPEALPAIARAHGDEAATRISRIADAQRWLIDQQSRLPTIPFHGDPSTRAIFLEHLAAFWRAPVAAYPDQRPVARVQAFALRWAAVMSDEAALGVADGSLDEKAREAILAFTRTQGHLTPPHVHVHELTAGTFRYAGSLVVTNDHDAPSALLFTPDRGWERFNGLEPLHTEIEERLRETLAATGRLPGLADDDAPTLTGDVSVTSREIGGDALNVLAENIVDVQRRRVMDAWTLRDDGEGRQLRLADRLHDALSAEHYLDVEAMLQRRQARLVTSVQELRLAQLPDFLRNQWRKALVDYRTALADAGRILANEGLDKVASIDQFARFTLGAVLRGRGIADDPADITIELFGTTSSITYGYSGTDVERRSLVDLARENFGFLEMRGMQARTSSGGFLLALGRDDIVDMIRGLDLRNSYQNYLVRQLKTSAQGQRARAASAQLQEARMRFELIDARSTAYIQGDTKDFIDDHAERGYRWVEAILDAPAAAGRRRVEHHDIVASHVVYEGARLKDVLAIGVRAQGSVYRTILYTPDAPDGRSFREFTDRQAAAASFLHNPAFEPYLLERLPAAWSTIDRDGATRRFRVSTGTRRAVWALSGQSGERPFTLTEGRFKEDEIAGNIFDASYDVALGQLGRDAAEFARSTGEADYDHAKSIGVLSARFAEGFLPVRLGAAAGSIRALHAIWNGIENVSRDERLQAFENFIDAFSSIGDLAASQVLVRSLGRTVLTKVPGRPRQLVASRVRLPDLDATFDPRYVDRGVRLQDARSVSNGVYEFGANRYIEHGGNAYRVHFDRDNATWRLRKPNHSSADYSPPVSRDGTGQWQHNKHVGLRGGASDKPDLYDREPAELLVDYRGLNPETAGLSSNDIDILVEALARQGLRSGVVKRLVYDRTHDRPTSAVLSRHWDSALEEARRPPPNIRTPSPPAPTSFELKKLERSQWPTTVWHYTTPFRHAMFKGTTLTLNQSLPAATGPSGLHVMTLDPNRPSRQIVEIMRGRGRSNSFTDERVRNIAGAYVEIDLGKLRDRQRADGTYEFNVYTVTRRSGLEFVIKPTLPAPDPGIAPLSPRRQRDLAGISLQAGEFRTGLRSF